MEVEILGFGSEWFYMYDPGHMKGYVANCHD